MIDTNVERDFAGTIAELKSIQKAARAEKRRNARFARLQAMPMPGRLDYMNANPAEYGFWRGECARRQRERNCAFCKKHPGQCKP